MRWAGLGGPMGLSETGLRLLGSPAGRSVTHLIFRLGLLEPEQWNPPELVAGPSSSAGDEVGRSFSSVF